ncbi:MAG: hypothetical protein M3Z85_09120 [Acidobacteriota bacterium]|nr:hypothetical protein [Acidobacteriota bacterium]
MKEWGFAQSEAADRLAQLQFFSVEKRHARGEIEFVITVREYVSPKEPEMLFFAEADKQTNQKVAAFTPSGWGRTLLDALSECIRAIHRFPYEGPEAG